MARMPMPMEVVLELLEEVDDALALIPGTEAVRALVAVAERKTSLGILGAKTGMAWLNGGGLPGTQADRLGRSYREQATWLRVVGDDDGPDDEGPALAVEERRAA